MRRIVTLFIIVVIVLSGADAKVAPHLKGRKILLNKTIDVQDPSLARGPQRSLVSSQARSATRTATRMSDAPAYNLDLTKHASGQAVPLLRKDSKVL